MEVNERIVEEYLKTIKGWFCMTDIPFEVPSNYSNIDILAYDPNDNKYYDIEDKFRSVYQISKNDFEKEDGEFHRFLFQFSRTEREQTIEKIIGKRKVTKVFVTTRRLFGKNDTIKNEFINRLVQKGYDAEVWFFDDIIPCLYNQINIKGRYNSELNQTLRLMKTYLPNETNNHAENE